MATEPLGPTASAAPEPGPGPAATPVHVQLVPIDAIKVSSTRRRALAEVDGLRESIAANGLLQPILLDPSMRLICGLHRLEACRALGWREIPALVQTCSPAEARLAEVDENLCRRELTVLERAEHIALRKKLWDEVRAAREAAHPADPPKARAKARSRREELAELAVFVDDTARRTGRAQAAVREEIRIGELPEEVRSLARETPLCNNRRELLALARMPEDEQREALERVRAGEAKSVRKRAPRHADAEAAAAPHDAHEAPAPEPEPLPSGEALLGRLRAIMDADEALPPPASGGEEAARVVREALEEAQRALERALAHWPADDAPADDGEPSATEVLRQTVRTVRRLADAVRRRAA